MERKEAYNYLKATVVLSDYQKIDDDNYKHLIGAVKAILERINDLEKENAKLKLKLKNKKRLRLWTR
jgi:uncharacterized tellurite resistance protein B-like protein